MAISGCFAHVILPDRQSQVRWVKVDEFWLQIHDQRKDAVPCLIFHVSGMVLAEAYTETNQLHSLKISVAHSCEFPYFYIWTPNQFDIAALRKAILAGQDAWAQFIASKSPEFPLNFRVDLTGKFVYGPADLLQFGIAADLITVRQLNKPDIVVPINPKFDIHPQQEKDVKWIRLAFSIDGMQQSMPFHCFEVEDMKKIVNILLQCKAKLPEDPSNE
jgi:hypothetical protein